MNDFTVEDLLVALVYDGDHIPLRLVGSRLFLGLTSQGIDVTMLFGEALRLGLLTLDCGDGLWYGFDMTDAGVEVARRADYDQFTAAIRWKVPEL